MKSPGYKEYASLKKLNTLGTESIARYLYPLYSINELPEICRFAHQKALPLIPLGSGSNVVFYDDLNAILMPVLCKNREVSGSDKNDVFITVGAGHNWHELVRWTLKQGYYGLENLSLIPGTVGAAPIQNIGAYGIEIKDFLISVKGYCLLKNKYLTLTSHECEFGYRDSVFKQKLHGTFIITEITLRLSKIFLPNLTYDGLQKAVNFCGDHKALTGLQLSNIVCEIRRNKLPDPGALGNVGSFFKNPVVTKTDFHKIFKQFPDVIAYEHKWGSYKLAAGWLIDACGFKGYRTGDAGVFKQQALVLVNYGKATGKDILALAEIIRQKVFDTFSIMLEIEPCIYP